MAERRSIFSGVFFLLLAAALVANKLGYLEGIGLWPILLTIALAAFVIKGLINGSFATILFSLAFLVIVHDEVLHLEALTPWPILGAAMLGTIGLNMLFPGFGNRWQKVPGCEGKWQKFFFNQKNGGGIAFEENRDGGTYSYDSIFSSAVKYVSGDVECVNIDSAFGSLYIYFVDAQLPNGHVDVNLDSMFGKIVLYVPAAWKVNMESGKVFANIRERGICIPDGAHEMYIRADNIFGSITIIYVQDR